MWIVKSSQDLEKRPVWRSIPLSVCLCLFAASPLPSPLPAPFLPSSPHSSLPKDRPHSWCNVRLATPVETALTFQRKQRKEPQQGREQRRNKEKRARKTQTLHWVHEATEVSTSNLNYVCTVQTQSNVVKDKKTEIFELIISSSLDPEANIENGKDFYKSVAGKQISQ